MSVGKVYLVGAGPGDPGLLTLKGAECLARADLVLYDGLVNPLILRHSHAAARRTCRVDGPQGRRLNQDQINQQLVEAAQAGQTVVRLKGGDPFVFGRGSEEAAALAKAGIPYEIVPGITAATACAAYSGISLTHREHASAVAFVTGHEDPAKNESALDYGELARFPGTLVFYMGLHRLEVIASALISQGKPASTPVAVICRGTTAQQRTVTGSLENIAAHVASAGLRPPSLIVVGECVSLRDEIQWFESRPLLGVTIGITTPEHQADGPIERAFALGAQPVLMPMIDISPIDDWATVDQVIADLPGTDWLVFTSVNGVDAFLNHLWKSGGDGRRLGPVRLAAIGESTAARLREHHLQPDLVPDVFRAEALAESLAPHVRGKKVVWLRADRGRDVLPEAMRQAGADYSEAIVYRHADAAALPGAIGEMLRDGRLDWICLSSPSIARNVAALIPAEHRSRVKFAAISPVTSDAAAAAGLAVSAIATTHTWQGMLDAVAAAPRA